MTTTDIGAFAKTNMPSILTGIGLISEAGALYSMYKCADKINDVVSNPTLTKRQKFLGVMKAGAVPFILSAISGTCIVSAQIQCNQRIAALNQGLAASTAAAAVATRELREFHAKTKEVVGEEKYNEIRQGIADDRAKETKAEVILEPTTEVNHISAPGGGNQLWYDIRHDRWFRKSYAGVIESIKSFNKVMSSWDQSSMAELYTKLELKAPACDDIVVWTSHNCPEGIHLIEDQTCIYPDTGEPARVFAIDETPEINPEEMEAFVSRGSKLYSPSQYAY